MENKFELASRYLLRFPINGSIPVEQLWKIDEDVLKAYEAQLEEVVEKYGKSTRRSRGRKTNEQVLNELRLAIVTHIIDVKEAEELERTNAAANKRFNEGILELIQNKKQAELAGKSIEELEAMLR